MSVHKSNPRRKLLIGLSSGIVGATQLPKSWHKPVVNAVMLPAHAETTDDSGTLPPEVTTTTTTTTAPAITDFSGSLIFSDVVGDNTLIEDALAVIVPNAYAGIGPAEGQMCIKVAPPVEPGASYSAKVLLVRGQTTAVYAGTGTVNGGPTVLAFDSGCVDESPTLNVSSVDDTGAVYTLSASGGNTAGTLPPGSDCPADSDCSWN